MKIIDKINYVDKANSVMESLLIKDKSKKFEANITTSKIRNILMMVSELYNSAVRNRGNVLSDDIVSGVQYMKMRLIYEMGREDSVKTFAEKAQLLNIINEIGSSKENLILFCRYMEALVAYHKFYGGKEGC